MEIKAEAHIIKSNGEEMEIERTFKSYEAAEEWVKNMFDNERCYHAGCPTLGMARDLS